MTAQTAWAASGDIIVVDCNGGGDYTTINDAVGAATGGETIFIKNGEYNEGFTIALEKSLSFVGESQDGVRITGPNKSLFSATVTAVTLSFTKLTILNAGNSTNPAFNFRSSAHDVTITNCTFDNCSSRYGTMQLSGTATIDGCTFLHSKASASSGAGAIYISGAGTYTIKNTIIDDVQYTYGNGYMYGAIYVVNASATLNIENTTITNVNNFDNEQNVTPVPARAVIYNNGGTVNITGSKIQGNTLSNTTPNNIIYNKGTVKIEQTVISDNTCANEVFYNYGSSPEPELTVNYCNIQDNTASGIVNDQGTIDLEANYWGSNKLPAGITATTWVVENNGEYTLNSGDPLEKSIPGLTDEEESFILPEGTIYVSETGSDENDGMSEGSPIASLAQAVEIVKNRENKTATVYMLNGDYTTGAIDIGDDVGISLSIIGQEKGEVVIHGTGAYIFDVYGDDLVWSFKNLVFDGISSTERTSAALVLYSKNTNTSPSPKGNFTIDNCIFRNINSKLGAIAIGNDYGNTKVTNCIIENVTGSAFSTAILTVNGNGTYTLDNIEIKNCRLDESVASYLRSVIYVNTYYADVTISNSKICNNDGPMMSLIESRSKLTIVNTTISDNVVNTSANGANGGDVLIWASSDNSNINITQCTITGNTIAKSGKGLFYNQKGSMNVEYSDISGNTVDAFIGSTGTITADNNWWGTNDQPDTKVDNWVIMNVEVDDSDLSQNNKLTLTIDFNHVKTSSGEIEELTGGEIPKESYTVAATAQNGQITPASVVVNKGEVKSQTFTVTKISDVITLTCDGDAVPITIEGVPPYRGTIYVDTNGSDDNEGSENAPVATVGKAVELALVDGGSHEIIINEGTYVGNGYHVTGDLTVTGNGKVTLDANNEGRLFYMDYGDTANKIELKNLILTNAIGYGAAVNSFADELILENDTIVKNSANGYLIKSYGKLTIKYSEISESKSGNVIQQDAPGDIFIKNTVFANDTIHDTTSVMAVVNINSGSGNMVIEDSKFIKNTARQGVIKGNFNYNIKVKGTEFRDNTNEVAYGGAIYIGGGNLDITNCVFNGNKAYRSGGAIYVGWRVTATVDSCIFIGNTANTMGGNYYGDAIYNGNKLTVTNSAFLGDATNNMIYNDGEDNVVTAQNCWWGTNEDPSSMNGVGYYEDDNWEEWDCPPVDVSNWVTMSAAFTPADAQAGEEVTVTATFSNDKLPDGIPVKFASTSGNLDADVSTTVGAIASTTYTIDASDEAITATSGNVTIEMPIVNRTVTQDNFYSFFDESGYIREDVTFDELIFQGEFSELAEGYVIIDKPVTITGDNAVLNDMGIVIYSKDVAIDNLTLNATTSLGDLIHVGASHVGLTNLNITYVVGDEGANVINVVSDVAGDEENRITNVSIKNNTIYFKSHATSDEELVTAINLDNVKDVIVDGNTITADYPSLSVATYDYVYFMMGLVYVNPVRVYKSNDVELTNNNIDVTVNSYSESFPTVQALSIVACNGVLVQGNNFTMVDDITPAGNAIYLYAVECGFSDGIEFIENNLDISTNGGQSGMGSVYAFEVATSEATFIGNNITCESNCANVGISSPYGYGPAKSLIIKDNLINITGLATESNEFALISGIEIQTGYATIKNNTIYVQNKGGYDDSYPVSGVSAIQYSASTLSFDIQDNEILVPDGKYAVEMLYAPSKATVTGNILCAHELISDAAVYIKSGDNNTVENNHLTAKEVTVDEQTDYWTTFYCGVSGLTFDDETNACAYTATVSGTTITLHKLGRVIPTGTAVIIVSEDEYIDLKISTAEAENTVGNNLHGVDMPTALSKVKKSLDADAILVLSNKGGNFGFHELATTNVPARKAFLAINDPSGAREFTMVFEDATGIKSIDHETFLDEPSGKAERNIEHSVYDLQGRRVSQPTNGLYIVNGKKVVIK